ncbi:GIY-YIG nuclease family protein [Paraburkholderia sp. A3RO-2L]|uniref:GIY-YIG nuclease family protein n=1 Tax=unclassified Paraburkholderia TaxID=2615204 RepID=UPI003DA7D0E3
MQNFDPMTAAARAIQQARGGSPVYFDDGPVGDLERDALAEGLPLWLEAKGGCIYLAANASWPGLFKIGCTRRSVESRMRQLGGAGMATPWVAVQVWEVHDAHGLEARAHKACQKWQVKGELFHAALVDLVEAIEAVIAADRAAVAAAAEAVFLPTPFSAGKAADGPMA